MQQLMSRRGSVLSTRAWVEEPWEGLSKSDEQYMFDYGLQLSSIFERRDRLFRANDELEPLTRLLRDCVELAAGMQDLRNSMVISPDFKFNYPRPTPTGLAPYFLKITTVGIQLGACSVGYESLERLETLFSQSTTAGFAKSMSCLSVGNTAMLMEKQRKQLAREILDTIPMCLKDGTVSGTPAMRVHFSFRLAMQQFEHSELEYRQGQALMESLKSESKAFVELCDPEES